MAAGLLERESELAAIDGAVERACAGHGGVLVIEGVAGIGKSSLLAAAVGSFAGRVLTARASVLEQAYAFGTVRALFDPVRADAAEWAAVTADAAALALRALDPSPAAGGPGDDAAHATSHGLFWLAANLATERPLLIAVDDAHWADPASLRWLGHLSRRIDTLPLLVLLAVRSGEPPSDPVLLDDLLGAPSLRPSPLGRSATAALVRARIDATDDVCTACHGATGGNPFLVRALAASLVGGDVVEIAAFGPEAVAREVSRTLERLGPAARDTARAVAILGPGAAPHHVRALADAPREDAALAADALRAAGLLAPEARLEFAHPILAAAVLAGLGPGQTALWHRRAWRLLHAEGADVERQALQVLQVDPEGDQEAVATLRAAAREAAARGASESASTFLRRALAEPPAAVCRPELLLECGLALAAHRNADAPALLHEAIALIPAGAARVEAGLHAARALALAALYRDVVEIGNAALADTTGAKAETVARLEAELVGLGMTRAESLAEGRVRVERARDDPPPVSLWIVNAAGIDTYAGAPAGEILARLRNPALAGERDSLVGTVVLGLMLTWNDDLEAALAHADGLFAIARPRGWASAAANAGFVRAMATLRAGRVAEAVEDARASYEFKVRVSPPDSLAWAVIPFADALLENGRADEAEAVLERLGVDALAPGLLVRPQLLEARARIRLAQQRPRDALADAREAAADWVLLECDGPGLATWRLCAVEALVALDEHAEARELAATQLVRAERHGALTSRLAALRAVAHAARPADAIATLERAAALGVRHDPDPPPYGARPGHDSPPHDDPARSEPAPLAGLGRLEHVRVLADLGAALRRAGRLEAAREPLREALHLADRDGAARLAARAREELQLAGARPRRAALTGRDALTPAERRVAQLAAEGRTNRQIAQELFVTQRTVETHLTHTFAKLDIRARDELAGALWPAPVAV